MALQIYSNLEWVHSLLTHYFLTGCSNDVQVFLSEMMSLLGEVRQHREESFQVEVKESFWVFAHERFHALVKCSVLQCFVVVG